LNELLYLYQKIIVKRLAKGIDIIYQFWYSLYMQEGKAFPTKKRTKKMTDELYTLDSKGYANFNRKATSHEFFHMTPAIKAQYGDYLDMENYERLAEFKTKFSALINEYQDALVGRGLIKHFAGVIATEDVLDEGHTNWSHYSLVRNLKEDYVLKSEAGYEEDDFDEDED
jgi:hypothetical protein